MANPKHIKILLEQGVEAWNLWRKEQPDIIPNLRGANLRKAILRKADLSYAVLSHADLGGVNLRSADLFYADLTQTDFERADLNGADLRTANLSGANLIGVDLSGANLESTFLNGADLGSTFLNGTILANLDLSNVKGLDTSNHTGPSIIDHRTLTRSGPLPLSFLRGIGLPNTYIDYIPSLFNQPLQFYSCFISYSSKDQEFAERLYADLQNKGVRCWYAPEDLPIGAKIRVGIDEAIRRYDKLLLILSENSVNSQWVEQEVETALEKERERNNQVVLFPVRLDDAVMESGDGWTRLIKNTRNIGDFCQWKDHDAYQKTFERLVRDLKASLVAKG